MQDDVFQFRRAVEGEIPAIRDMHAASVWRLCQADYSPAQITAIVEQMGTMDDHVVHDRRLFIALAGQTIVGSAGWSTRPPGYALIGNGMAAHAGDGQPRIRSVFVHPDWTRRGLARRLMQIAENEIAAAGWRTIELGATLTGVPLYQALGYVAAPRRAVLLPSGVAIPFVPMVKSLMREAA